MVSNDLIEVAKTDGKTVSERFATLQAVSRQFLEATDMVDVVVFNAEFMINMGLLKLDHMMGEPDEENSWDDRSATRHWIEDYEAMERWAVRITEYMALRVKEYCDEIKMSDSARLHLVAIAVGATVLNYQAQSNPHPRTTITEYLEAYHAG